MNREAFEFFLGYGGDGCQALGEDMGWDYMKQCDDVHVIFSDYLLRCMDLVGITFPVSYTFLATPCHTIFPNISSTLPLNPIRSDFHAPSHPLTPSHQNTLISP